MADIEYARRAEVKVTIGGHDATEYVTPSLTELSFTDNISGKADDLQITLHDRDGRWSDEWMPSKGMAITADIICHDWEKSGEDIRLPCGSFKVDEVEFSGPPQKVTVKGVTSELVGEFRDTRKNRAWEGTTLFKVLADEAQRNGLKPDIDLGPDGDVPVERMDQRNESDLSYATRIAEERGYTCKTHSGKLVVRDVHALESQEPVVEIPRTGSMYSPSQYSFKSSSAGTAYTGAKVRYTHARKGKTMTAKIKAGKAAEAEDSGKIVVPKEIALDRKADSPKEAARLGKGALAKANKDEDTLSISMMGAPRLVSGVVIILTGFGKFSGRYLIRKAEHKFTTSGYTTSLELSKCRLLPDRMQVLTAERITARDITPAESLAKVIDDKVNSKALQEVAEGFKSVLDAAREGLMAAKLVNEVIESLPAICLHEAQSAAQSLFEQWEWTQRAAEYGRWLQEASSTVFTTAAEYEKYLDEVAAYVIDAGEAVQSLTEEARDYLYDWLMLPDEVALGNLQSWLHGMASGGFDATGGTFIYRTLTSAAADAPKDISRLLSSYQVTAYVGGFIRGARVTVDKCAIKLSGVVGFGVDTARELGYWAKTGEQYASEAASGFTKLTEESFRTYRQMTGKGHDFRVRSGVYLLPNFDGFDFSLE